MKYFKYKFATAAASLAVSTLLVSTQTYSSPPDDPFLVDSPEKQWWAFDLNLPGAWELTDGHAYVGWEVGISYILITKIIKPT